MFAVQQGLGIMGYVIRLNNYKGSIILLGLAFDQAKRNLADWQMEESR